MALVRWNPTKELMNIEREFGKLFNTFGSRFGLRDSDDDFENAVWSPLTDISEDNDKYTLSMDIPGVDKKDVKISYKNGSIVVSGERKQESEEKTSKYHRIERAYGKYYREFMLPEKIIEDKIEAKFKDGTLTVIIPKAEEAKPREIDIKVN
ncbi:heat shock protein hsp20 [hydrocarbon metagenome]|uniref:Heat shock protein hsp20 n=1 Tax=hydrocarbon metagenome TaxID=938273 RepID=A0A0W8FVG4_9ZZZZ